MVMASLVELVENLTFFLNSALSFYDFATPKEQLQWLAMVISYHVPRPPTPERFEVCSFGEHRASLMRYPRCTFLQ